MKVYEIIFDSTVPQEDIACAIKHLEKEGYIFKQYYGKNFRQSDSFTMPKEKSWIVFLYSDEEVPLFMEATKKFLPSKYLLRDITHWDLISYLR